MAGRHTPTRVFDKENQATYCEVYAPSFSLERQSLLADEVRKFADHCRKTPPLPRDR